MVYIDPEFEVPGIPEGEQYEGTEIDANILKALPEGSQVQWVATYGASAWAISSKVDITLHDGKEQSYFSKIYTAGIADAIARGEYESTKALYEIIPNNVPKPLAWGPCADNPKRAFFIAEFRDMTDEMPGIDELAAVTARIHQQQSPNGKFGFHVMTFGGKHPNDTNWCDTWEEFFIRAMKDTMTGERATHGPNEELDQLSPLILTNVIPRLIRPMETEGRSITPVLLHGDMWHGNISVDNETGQTVVYDPCSFYGHYEYDFGMWRASRYRTNKAHVRAYYKLAGMSEPVEDQDDRHALYALQEITRNDLSTSICWPGNKRMRDLAIVEMRRLVEKYQDGYEGYQKSKAAA
ncbi:hypothetical protein FSARC_2549 [Fusarium sarcochroum]|uniref:protein-ribulosamine 3-kinase n=1 Tax=Fusarium sarcochroum TaxID=1208366 RepID=A0A8H4XDR4_9HYPO|nr:hypothetical protein FSARC_2549 [Fusarium sarcochroum]